jgi:muramoyltetrapeptide carboxypeptidase
MQHVEVTAPRWPAPLEPGSKVVVVSPASAPAGESVRQTVLGVEVLRGWGLDVRYEPREPAGFLACEDSARRAWVQEAFDDPAGAAVVCSRGGYGTQRIVDELDVAALVRRRAAFVGFSDITPLHTVLNREGLVTWYGPPLSKLPASPRTAASLKDALLGEGEGDIVLRSDAAPLVSGAPVRAPVLGGTLALIASSVGTRSALSAAGAIVLFEDVREPPRKIDRALTQLIRSGALRGARAFVIGQLTDCVGRPGEPPPEEVFRERLAGFGVPVVGGFPVGHGEDPQTVPLGAIGVLDPDAGALRFARPH